MTDQPTNPAGLQSVRDRIARQHETAARAAAAAHTTEAGYVHAGMVAAHDIDLRIIDQLIGDAAPAGREQLLLGLLGEAVDWIHEGELRDRICAALNPQEESGAHRYLSTGCLHGEHDYCQAMTGMQGVKRPARCKFCDADCICPCHA